MKVDVNVANNPSSILYGPQLGSSWTQLGPIWECCLGNISPKPYGLSPTNYRHLE